jgi:flagellar operon protein
MNKINMNNDYVLRRSKITGVGDAAQKPKSTQVQKPTGPSFQEVLDRVKQSDEVKFSKHAINRLETRNINLSDKEIQRITEGVSKAQAKGVKEALILMDSKVFIASVKNKTIITASTEEDLKDSVFTNIDGAVIV